MPHFISVCPKDVPLSSGRYVSSAACSHHRCVSGARRERHRPRQICEVDPPPAPRPLLQPLRVNSRSICRSTQTFKEPSLSARPAPPSSPREQPGTCLGSFACSLQACVCDTQGQEGRASRSRRDISGAAKAAAPAWHSLNTVAGRGCEAPDTLSLPPREEPTRRHRRRRSRLAPPPVLLASVPPSTDLSAPVRMPHMQSTHQPPWAWCASSLRRP